MSAPARARLARLAARLVALQQRFDQRRPRERALLLTAAIALSLGLADALWLGPALTAYRAARLEQRSASDARVQLLSDLQQRRLHATQLDRNRQSDVNSWRQRVRDGDARLREHEHALIGPDQMLELLERMLAQQGQLRVRAMQSLPRTDLLAAAAPAGAAASGPATPAAAAAGTAATASLYRHGVELTLEGSFGDLLNYLKSIEALPQRVLWGSLGLKVSQYPNSLLTLRLYTLSRDRHWLEI